jgi:hypothetical protein
VEAKFNLTIDIKGTFTGVKVGDKSFSLEQWNDQFSGKPAK